MLNNIHGVPLCVPCPLYYLAFACFFFSFLLLFEYLSLLIVVSITAPFFCMDPDMLSHLIMEVVESVPEISSVTTRA